MRVVRVRVEQVLRYTRVLERLARREHTASLPAPGPERKWAATRNSVPAIGGGTDCGLHVRRWSIACAELVRAVAATARSGCDCRTRTSIRNRPVAPVIPCFQPSRPLTVARPRPHSRVKRPACQVGATAVHDSCTTEPNWCPDQASGARRKPNGGWENEATLVDSRFGHRILRNHHC